MKITGNFNTWYVNLKVYMKPSLKLSSTLYFRACHNSVYYFQVVFVLKWYCHRLAPLAVHTGMEFGVCVSFLGLPWQSTPNWVAQQYKCIVSQFWRFQVWDPVWWDVVLGGWGDPLCQATLTAFSSSLAVLALLGLWQHRPSYCPQVPVALSLCVFLCPPSPFYKSSCHIGLKLRLLERDPIRSSYVSNDSIFR